MRTLAADIATRAGSTVTVQGWVHRIRDMGKFAFLVLRDRSGEVQVVMEGRPDFPVETVVSVEGQVAENPKAPGGFEVQATACTVLGLASPELPIPINQDPDKLGLEAILDNRILSLRIPKIRAAFVLQSDLIRYFSDYLRAQDFTEIKTSKLIGQGTEGGAGLFEVKYFDTKVFLAQSPQFYKQAMIASGLERVFEVAPAYRAEKHDTPRHLSEYVSMDVEMAFIKDEHDLMDLECGILQHVFEQTRKNNAKQLALWNADVPDPDSVAKIPRISHDECKEIISKMSGTRAFEINPEGERLVCDWAEKERGIAAVFVNDWPRKARPFYAHPNGTKTHSFDLLFRGLEITTGGKRIHDYAMLLENLPKFGLTEEGLGDYPKIFKYGCPPHGGFAIGLERLTQKILGMSNVKEASLFPRDRKRTTP